MITEGNNIDVKRLVLTSTIGHPHVVLRSRLRAGHGRLRRSEHVGERIARQLQQVIRRLLRRLLLRNNGL